MVSLQKVEPSRFADIYPLLRSRDSRFSQDTWKNLFDYQWNRESYCGYGLFDENKAVGYLGMIFSQRQIAQKKYNFCNLTNWVVKPEYRSHSLSLMMPIMRLKDHTITDLSATEEVVKISERLGFKCLDTAIRVLLPYPISISAADTAQLYSNNEIAGLPLETWDLEVFAHHQPYSKCHQLVLQSNEDYCHIIYTTHGYGPLSYCHIQSISNVLLFKRYQALIRHHIIRDTGISLIVIDSRLVASIDLPFSFQLKRHTPRIYRSEQLQPDQIDNLYSECILLDVSLSLRVVKLMLDTFPILRKVKSQLIQRSCHPETT